MIDFIITWFLVYLIISLAEGEWTYEMLWDSDSRNHAKYALNIQFDEEYFYKERFLFNIQIAQFNFKDSNFYLPLLNSLWTEIFGINSARCRKTKKKIIL